MTEKLLISGVEIDPLDDDYSLSDISGNYLWTLLEKANQLGLEGTKIKAMEVRENFATFRRYIEFLPDTEALDPHTN